MRLPHSVAWWVLGSPTLLGCREAPGHRWGRGGVGVGEKVWSEALRQWRWLGVPRPVRPSCLVPMLLETQVSAGCQEELRSIPLPRTGSSLGPRGKEGAPAGP